eukprot:Gb_31763 [translate_table: standard]
MEEMKSMGIGPNVKTYTTLVHGWALASLPEKALSCFEEMKQVGLEPDQAVYHCLMTSLLSRAAVAQNYVYSGILRISKEMLDLGFTVDLATATYWSKSLCKVERIPGELTRAVEKIFPPSWYSYVRNRDVIENDDMCSDKEDTEDIEVLEESPSFGPLR